MPNKTGTSIVHEKVERNMEHREGGSKAKGSTLKEAAALRTLSSYTLSASIIYELRYSCRLNRTNRRYLRRAFFTPTREKLREKLEKTVHNPRILCATKICKNAYILAGVKQRDIERMTAEERLKNQV